jgi:hypothetical protein
VRDEGREFPTSLQWISDRLTLANILPGAFNRFLEHPIVHDPLGDIQGIEQLHAACQHCGQRARQSGDGDHPRDVSDQRESQCQAVYHHAASFRADKSPNSIDAGENQPDQHHPIIRENLAGRHEGDGRPWQSLFLLGEDLRDLGNDEGNEEK